MAGLLRYLHNYNCSNIIFNILSVSRILSAQEFVPKESYRCRPEMKNYNSKIFKNDISRINDSAFVYIVFAVNLLPISDD